MDFAGLQYSSVSLERPILSLNPPLVLLISVLLVFGGAFSPAVLRTMRRIAGGRGA
ncbi:MAG: hypothetical protein ACK4F7_04955 [Inhella sp.]